MSISPAHIYHAHSTLEPCLGILSICISICFRHTTAITVSKYSSGLAPQHFDEMRGSQSGDLAILSAERYDDGLKYRSSHVATSAVVTRRSKKTAGAVVTPAPDDGPARKRHKASPPDGTGEDDEKKRSRGRPRLEPKDETAQDVNVLSFIVFSIRRIFSMAVGYA